MSNVFDGSRLLGILGPLVGKKLQTQIPAALIRNNKIANTNILGPLQVDIDIPNRFKRAGNMRYNKNQTTYVQEVFETKNIPNCVIWQQFRDAILTYTELIPILQPNDAGYVNFGTLIGGNHIQTFNQMLDVFIHFWVEPESTITITSGEGIYHNLWGLVCLRLRQGLFGLKLDVINENVTGSSFLLNGVGYTVDALSPFFK